MGNSCSHYYANAVVLAINRLCLHLPATLVLWTKAMQPIMLRMSLQASVPDLWSQATCTT